MLYLQILSLPDFKTCYYVKGFPIGQKVLVDSVQQKDRSAVERGETQVENASVQELLLVGLGYQKTRPYLMVRSYINKTFFFTLNDNFCLISDMVGT